MSGRQGRGALQKLSRICSQNSYYFTVTSLLLSTDCVVLASSSEATETSQELRLRVQGKEKHQMLEISLSPDSPLKVLMSHYEEAMGLSGHKLSFFFDGTKLSGKELPADLGLESGDLIEVWG